MRNDLSVIPAPFPPDSHLPIFRHIQAQLPPHPLFFLKKTKKNTLFLSSSLLIPLLFFSSHLFALRPLPTSFFFLSGLSTLKFPQITACRGAPRELRQLGKFFFSVKPQRGLKTAGPLHLVRTPPPPNPLLALHPPPQAQQERHINSSQAFQLQLGVGMQLFLSPLCRF